MPKYKITNFKEIFNVLIQNVDESTNNPYQTYLTINVLFKSFIFIAINFVLFDFLLPKQSSIY